MENTMFSVIIPVCNSASFLREAIESVLQQDYEDYEILLIDDESTDGSLEIEEDYAKSYVNVHLIRQKHGGAGAARNAGVRLAKGNYLLFLDADDYWRDTALLKKVDHQIRHRKSQVVMFQMIQVKENGILLLESRRPALPSEKSTYLLKEVLPTLVHDGQVIASACNKCVSKQLLMECKISFLEGTTCEDIDWVLHLFSHVKTISFINEEAYAYRQHRVGKRASQSDRGAVNLARIISKWARRMESGKVPNKDAVAGVVAFEYGIYMGYSYQSPAKVRKEMKAYRYLLDWGMDRKTRSIAKFYHICGYELTCFAVCCYLRIRMLRR